MEDHQPSLGCCTEHFNQGGTAGDQAWHEAVERVLDVLAPVPEGWTERCAIFEKPGEETPTPEDLRLLATKLVRAVLQSPPPVDGGHEGATDPLCTEEHGHGRHGCLAPGCSCKLTQAGTYAH